MNILKIILGAGVVGAGLAALVVTMAGIALIAWAVSDTNSNKKP